jgi:hypothetical protein
MAENRVTTKTRDKVRKLLKQGFGDQFKEIDGVFLGVHGTTVVMVRVMPWASADDAQVVIGAGVAMNVDLDEECMRFLLEKNSQVVLGAFGIEGGNSIVFSHTIVGSKIDKNELVASVRAVSATADSYDEVITEKWGGVKIDEMARRAALGMPPESSPEGPDDYV